MWRQDLPKYRDEALARVNAIRKAFGKRALKQIPRGKIQEARDCPMARALIALAPAQLRRHIRIRIGDVLVEVPLNYSSQATRTFADKLAETMNTEAHPVSNHFTGNLIGYSIPSCEAVRRFVKHFDEYRFPELVER